MKNPAVAGFFVYLLLFNCSFLTVQYEVIVRLVVLQSLPMGLPSEDQEPVDSSGKAKFRAGSSHQEAT